MTNQDTHPGYLLPLGLIAIAVAVATVVGALLGLGATQQYRSDAVFSISGLEGNDVNPAELKQISEDLVVVSSLPSVRQEVRGIGGVVPSFDFSPTVGTDEEADGVVRFSASHSNPDTAETLAHALATESVRFLIEGHTAPVNDPMAEANARTDQDILDQGYLISTVGTEPISSWPAFVRSAVTAAMVAMLTAVSLFAVRSAHRLRRSEWGRREADALVKETAATARQELQKTPQGATP